MKNYLLIILLFLLSLCKQETHIVKEISALPIKKAVVKTYDYDTTAWADIALLDSSIILDLRYASTDNFVKEKMYPCGRCFLRPIMAKRIIEAHRALKIKGLGLKLFDCYRPLSVQEKLWEKVPNPNYVTPPQKGSMHNRGLAVDLTIVDQQGEELDMGTPYDYFGQEAHHTFTKHSAEIAANRQLLKGLMESFHLKPIRTEWWHYSLRGQKFSISKMQWICL
jgi:D-alanyl-D-alanine dipeptidase